jgi:hypothetical protein
MLPKIELLDKFKDTDDLVFVTNNRLSRTTKQADGSLRNSYSRLKKPMRVPISTVLESPAYYCKLYHLWSYFKDSDELEKLKKADLALIQRLHLQAKVKGITPKEQTKTRSVNQPVEAKKSQSKKEETPKSKQPKS